MVRRSARLRFAAPRKPHGGKRHPVEINHRLINQPVYPPALTRQESKRLDQLEERVEGSLNEMQDMLAKAGALMTQTQTLLAETFGDAEEIAQAMQDSASKSHSYDLDELAATVHPEFDAPVMDSADDAEVIEVDIVTPTDSSGMPEAIDDANAGDDIFGQVLRRLRDENDDDTAAA